MCFCVVLDESVGKLLVNAHKKKKGEENFHLPFWTTKKKEKKRRACRTTSSTASGFTQAEETQRFWTGWEHVVEGICEKKGGVAGREEERVLMGSTTFEWIGGSVEG
jgi:hypothetical protein